MFLVADRNDDTGNANVERHQKLTEKLGDKQYYRLQCREIENLLTPVVIKEIVREYEEDPDAEFSDFEQVDYKDKHLGSFIESNVLKQAKKRKGSYAGDSGAVSVKTDFCQKAIAHLRDFADLSPEAQELIQKLHAFIQQNNN